MAPSGHHWLAAAASSTCRGVHELTPDLLLKVLFYRTGPARAPVSCEGPPMAALTAAPSARAKASARARMGRPGPAPPSTAPVAAAPAAAPPFMIELSQACVSVPLPLGAAAAAPPNRVASVGPRNNPPAGRPRRAAGRRDRPP